ncbi:MAG: hypothetical protein AB1454_04595 [Candidatus Auribacterota bacterium]
MKTFFRCAIFSFFVCACAFLCVAHSVAPQDNDAPVGPLPDTLMTSDAPGIMLEARSARQQHDYSLALVLYRSVITSFPDAPERELAEEELNELLKTLRSSVIQEIALRELGRSFSVVSRQLLNYDATRLLLKSFPSKKLFGEAKHNLKQHLSDFIVRFRMRYAAEPNTPLVYTGVSMRDGAWVFNFTLGKRNISVPQGGIVSIFKVTGYDPVTDAVTLTELKDLDYRLLQKNQKPIYRAFAAKVSHIPLNRTFVGYFYFDHIEEYTGFNYYGLVHSDEQKLTLDVPVESAIRSYNFEQNALRVHESFAVADGESAIEQKDSSFGEDDTARRNLARLAFYMQSRQWLNSVALSLSVIDKEFYPEYKDRFDGAYFLIAEAVRSTSRHERDLDKALYLMNNSYWFSALSELLDITASDAPEQVMAAARSALVDLAHKPELTWFTTSIEPIVFPVSFMGYNQTAEGHEQFQINHKGRSYFLGKGESMAGITMKGSEEKEIEVLNPSLNAMEKRLLRWLVAQTSSPHPVTLLPGESFNDPSWIYAELEDQLSGKIYPGYILLDSYTAQNNEARYGIITSDPSTSASYYFSGFSSDTPVKLTPKQQKDARIISTQDTEAMQMVEDFVGKISFSEIRKYYTLNQIDPSVFSGSDAPNPVENEYAPSADEKPVTEPEPARVQSEKSAVSASSAVQDQTGKPNVSQPETSPPDELEQRKAKLSLKKKLIRVLAVLIVLWMMFIIYKLVRALKSN